MIENFQKTILGIFSLLLPCICLIFALGIIFVVKSGQFASKKKKLAEFVNKIESEEGNKSK